MRKCPDCKFSKHDGEFAKSGVSCLQCRRERATLNRRATREAVLKMLGGKCTCCGEREYVFLDLDHINDDGAGDRRGATWRSALREPARFQILCRNCNWAKHIGTCPHKLGDPQ